MPLNGPRLECFNLTASPHLPCSASKVFPAFRQYIQCKAEEEEGKKAALLAELEPINKYLAQAGKVGRAGAGPGEGASA